MIFLFCIYLIVKLMIAEYNNTNDKMIDLKWNKFKQDIYFNDIKILRKEYNASKY